MRRTLLTLVLTGMIAGAAWAQTPQQTTEQRYRETIAKELFDEAIYKLTIDSTGTAYRLLQMAFALAPSSSIAGTLAEINDTPQGRSGNIWWETAFKLDPYDNTIAASYFRYHVRKEQYEKAREVMSKHIRLVPADNSGRLDLAVVNAQLGNLQEALQQIDTLLRQSDDSKMRQLAGELKVRILLQEDKREEASKALADMYDPRSGDVHQLIDQVHRILTLTGDAKQAFNLIKKSPYADSMEPQVVVLRAYLVGKLGDRKLLLQEAGHVIQNPTLELNDKIRLLHELLKYNHTSADLKEFVPYVKKLVELYPDQYAAHKLLLQVCYASPATPEYIQLLTNTFKQFPEESELPEFLVYAYTEKEELKKALNISEEGIKLQPHNLHLYYLKGSVLMLNNEMDKAFEAFNAGVKAGLALDSAAIDQDKKNSMCNLYQAIGDILFEKKQYDKAFANYDKALQYNPTDPGTLNNYAYNLALRNKNLKKALEMAQQAQEIDPNNATILDTYAYVLMKNGQITLAELYIKRAIEHADPPRAAYFDRYAEILLAEGNKKEAIQQLNKAQDLDPQPQRQEQIDSLQDH